MTTHDSWLDRDSTELAQLLVSQARRERAPRAARDRALLRLASTSVIIGTVAAASAGAGKVTPWLIGKWVALGLVASLTTFSAVDVIHQVWTRADRAAERYPHAPGPPARLEPASVSVAEPSPRNANFSTAVPGAVPRAARAREESAEPVARPQRPGLPSATRFDVENLTASAQLSREVARLQQARAALAAGSAPAALEALRVYVEDFPAGSLRAEAAALRVEAVATLGNRELARELAHEFERHFPRSPLQPRVRALSGLPPLPSKP